MKGFIEKVMDSICGNCASSGASMNFFYFLFRVLAGLLFMQHGIQKLFGGFGGVGGTGEGVEVFTLFGIAGLIEFFGGLAIALGLFTRLFALIATVEMLVAYFMVHNPKGFYPIVNQGELALMYFIVFLIMTVYGAGKWSLERVMVKREIF